MASSIVLFLFFLEIFVNLKYSSIRSFHSPQVHCPNVLFRVFLCPHPCTLPMSRVSMLLLMCSYSWTNKLALGTYDLAHMSLPIHPFLCVLSLVALDLCIFTYTTYFPCQCAFAYLLSTCRLSSIYPIVMFLEVSFFSCSYPCAISSALLTYNLALLEYTHMCCPYILLLISSYPRYFIHMLLPKRPHTMYHWLDWYSLML